VLSCYRHRRLISAWLDGALSVDAARATEAHVARCSRCSREADSLRRLSAALRATPGPSDPDWTGFWPAIVRGVEDARRTPAPRRRSAWLAPRWAYGGALAAALLVSLTVWQLMPERLAPDAPVIVRSANTDYPGAQVMVYSTPDRDLTVVWVFGAE
jgi:anti-sigma factor RsiW